MDALKHTPAEALARIISQLRWRASPKRRYHAGLKRSFNRALRQSSPEQSIDEALSDIVNVVSRRVERLHSPRRSTIIVGPFRVGKTTIAGAIHERKSHIHVPIDTIGTIDHKWPALAGCERRDEKIVSAIVSQIRDGVILEGGLDVDRPEIQEMSRHARMIFVGDVDCWEDRAQNILEYRRSKWCWTVEKHYDESSVFGIAKQIIERSRHLERVGREIGVPFVPIRGAHAEADIRSATEFIWSEINR